MKNIIQTLSTQAEACLDEVFESSRDLDPFLTRENIYAQGYCFHKYLHRQKLAFLSTRPKNTFDKF